MPNVEHLIIVIEEDPELSLDEFCHALQISPDLVYELIDQGAIEPKGQTEATWRFEALHVRKARRAMHLLQDLEVNLPGAVLAIDLIEQIEKLQAQVDFFERYVGQARRSRGDER